MKIIFLLLFFLCGCKSSSVENFNPLDAYVSPDATESLVPELTADNKVKEDYLTLVNEYRVSIGVGTLLDSAEIENEAQIHAENMASGRVDFGHTGSGDRCISIRNSLGPANLCGEIVAKGQDNPQEVFKAWMGSLGHRSKIENPRYTHTSLAFARDAQGAIYWVQIFLEVL